MTLAALRRSLRDHADPERARISRTFFKTGPGQYGEGDVFLGLSVPSLRALAKSCSKLSWLDLTALIRSRIHEERLLALLIAGGHYARGDDATRAAAVRFYLANRRFVNNWDLVDASAPQILGDYLIGRDRRLLDRLARSRHLWDRRIAIVSTYAFIKRNDYSTTLRLAAALLVDREELIHKAVGWMLREVGKRDRTALEAFLRRHAAAMPRTALRYAIERFPDEKRRAYLTGARRLGRPRAHRRDPQRTLMSACGS